MNCATTDPRGLFITGTDTGVGKTLFTAALALLLRQRGVDVGIMKPVETGVADPTALGPDASLLQWAADTDDEAELVSPYRFRAPLAPSAAAQKENRTIDCEIIKAAAEQLRARHEYLLVEGAGGLMVPLRGGLLMADLIRDLQVPLLVVARPDLGTINHTLLTTFAAQAMGLSNAGFVINNMPAEPDEAQTSGPQSLVSLASTDLLGVLHHCNGDDHEKVTTLAAEMEQMETLPWLFINLGLRHLIRNDGKSGCFRK